MSDNYDERGGGDGAQRSSTFENGLLLDRKLLRTSVKVEMKLLPSVYSVSAKWTSPYTIQYHKTIQIIHFESYFNFTP